jgi:hypothetical protein
MLRFDQTGHFTGERTIPEADTAHFELTQEAAGTAAQAAPVVRTNGELRLAFRLSNL